jgi:membrane-associated protein
MTYGKFIRFNMIWQLYGFSLVLVTFFGNLDFVKNNFETVILAIIGLSLLPMLIEIIRVNIKKLLVTQYESNKARKIYRLAV